MILKSNNKAIFTTILIALSLSAIIQCGKCAPPPPLPEFKTLILDTTTKSGGPNGPVRLFYVRDGTKMASVGYYQNFDYLSTQFFVWNEQKNETDIAEIHWTYPTSTCTYLSYPVPGHMDMFDWSTAQYNGTEMVLGINCFKYTVNPPGSSPYTDSILYFDPQMNLVEYVFQSSGLIEYVVGQVQYDVEIDESSVTPPNDCGKSP